ncbi:MFS transporter [Plantactinospora sp. GCM10030261]|uniref:MFS transporter n=1 Tax=Plantactinospora sp. GCM10030261 TaxID=3273420 RepID=UPI00360E45E9
MPRLVHDRTTWLAYAQLGVWGYFLYGFGPVVPLLRDEQGTTAAVAGLHSTAIAAGALLGGFLFAPLVNRLGRGGTGWLGLAGVMVGVVALTALRPLPATLTSVAVTATFGMLVVNGVVATLASRHGPAAPAAISEANAACAGMGLLAPLVVGITVGTGPGWRAAIAVEVGLIVAVALVARVFRVRPPRPAPAVAAAAGNPPASAPAVAAVAGNPPGRLPRPYWIAWLLMSATGSIEVCLSLWAALELRDNASMSPGGASAALSAIVGGMFLGRLLGGRVALRVAPVPLLLAALLVSLSGFALFWTAPSAGVAVAGLLVLGLGNALHYPLAIAIAMASAKDHADRAAGYASYSMAVGFGLAPVLLGGIADAVGVHLAFLLLPVFIVAAALLAGRLRRIPRPAVAGSPVG